MHDQVTVCVRARRCVPILTQALAAVPGQLHMSLAGVPERGDLLSGRRL